jgi:beta-1,3-galactosyltransferase 1
VFFVGLTDKSAWLQDALEYEAKQFGDIVQEDFLDTYRNLSFKGVAALKWITTYCNQTSYIMKTDDDIFVNMFALLKHLKDLYIHNYRNRLIMCLVWWRMHVLREGKWGIPKEQLPDELYPVYCSGMGFVLTTDVAMAMYYVSYYVKFHWVDDAYISGFLPRALRGAVNHTDMSRAYCGVQEMGVYSHQTEWYKYVFTHVHDEQLYHRTCNKLVDIATHRSIPTPTVVRPGLLADDYISKDVLFPELRKKREQRAQERKKRKDKEKKGSDKSLIVPEGET